MRQLLSRVSQTIPKTCSAPVFSSGMSKPVPLTQLTRADTPKESPKMEFTLIQKDDLSQARLCQLEIRESVLENGATSSDVECQAKTYQTPMFFIHTIAGSIPHITSEVLDIMLGSKPSPPILISIDSINMVVDCVGPARTGLAKFVGLPSCSTMLIVNNPLTTLPPNYNDKLGTSIWSRFGRHTLTIAKYNKIIQDLKPNLYQIMSDYDVSKDSTKKRTKKSTERNVDYMEKHFASMKEAGVAGSHSAYATIEFNWFLVDAVESSKALFKMLESRDRIAGFFINGVAEHFKGQDQEGEEGSVQALQTLSTILSKLPEDKPKFIPGPFELPSIVELVKLGVDQFDSSFITQLTDKGQALHLRFDASLQENGYSNQVPVPTEALIANNDNDETLNLDRKNDEADADRSLQVLDLNEKRYLDDFRPISDTCLCYTCRKYSRSYIHHLLVTGELLAMVLLMGHNLFSFDRLFQAIRTCLETSRSPDKLLESL